MFEGSDGGSSPGAAVFTHLLACLSELQSLPQDEEYQYFAQFPEFRRITQDLKSRAFALLQTVTAQQHWQKGLYGAQVQACLRLQSIRSSLRERSAGPKSSPCNLHLKFAEPKNNALSVVLPANSKWRQLADAMSCPVLCEEVIPDTEVPASVSAHTGKESQKRQDCAQLIDSADALHSVCARLGGAKELGVFVAYHRCSSFLGFTRALALATQEDEFILDAVALRSHFSELQAVFANPAVTKVMHRAGEFTPLLARDLGLIAHNCFDLSHAAEVLQLPSSTLSFLSQSYCGQEVDPLLKSDDWSCEVLSQSHLRALRSAACATVRLHSLLREDLELKADSSAVRAVTIQKAVVQKEQSEEPKGTFAKLKKWRRRVAQMTDQSEETVCPEESLRKWSEFPPTPSDLQSSTPSVRLAAAFLLETTKKPQKRTQPPSKPSSDLFERVGWKPAGSQSEQSYKPLLDKQCFSESHIEALFESDSVRGLSILSKMKEVGRLPYISLGRDYGCEDTDGAQWDERRIPASVEDIYELSNTNRKKAKKGKTLPEVTVETLTQQKSGEVLSLFKALGWGAADVSPRMVK